VLVVGIAPVALHDSPAPLRSVCNAALKKNKQAWGCCSVAFAAAQVGLLKRSHWWVKSHDTSLAEGQPYPGLHPKQRGQQVEGGDSAPLLRSGETSLGVLHPALEPSAQERHGAVGAGPEEATK